MQEEWRPCAANLAYEVSSRGAVRRRGKKKPLSLSMDRHGYFCVNLSRKGKPRKYRVHRLVCLAFNGPSHDQAYVCHKNDVRSDNRASNLYWGSPSQNGIDRTKNGFVTPHKGLAHTGAYSKETYDKVHSLLAAGLSTRKVADQTGVGLSTVQNIFSGKHFTCKKAILGGYLRA